MTRPNRLEATGSHRGAHIHACRLALALAALLALPVAQAADTCPSRPVTAPTPDANATAAASAQALLDALVATNGVPGMGAAVWRNGAVVWTGCSGWRDVAAKVPVQRDTVFRFASVSKVIAATAAAKLHEDGKLDLDAPVAGLLPWLRNDWPTISVRQLAAHISGMPHYQSVDATRGRVHYATARDAVGIFAGRELLSAPGTSYAYSSWGYTLIGAVIEAQSGRHFLDYVITNIVPGLRIQADSDGHGAGVSRLYDIDSGTPRTPAPHDFSYTWPGGGLAGTPEALARFGGRLLRGEIVSPVTLTAMLEPMRLASGELVRERDYVLGLGWRTGTDVDGGRIVHHAGVTDGARSALMLWPEQDTVASVLSNALWVSSIEQTAMMLAAPFRPQPAGLRAVACPTNAVRYRGRMGARRFEGPVVFHLADGRCIGELGAVNALGEHFASARAWPQRTLRVVALAADSGLARAALVTPYGLYDLRALDAQRFSARLGDELSLELLP